MSMTRARLAVALTTALLLMATVAFPRTNVDAYTALDQQWDEPNFSGSSANVIGFHFAQTFTAGKTGLLTKIDAKVWPHSPISVEIRGVDANGTPLTTSLAQETVDRTWLNDWETFTFTAPQTVTTGTTYALVITQLAAGTLKWSGGSGNPYPAGMSFTGSGTGFSPDADFDFGFRAYVNLPDPSPPVVTPVLDPAAPNGANGWYTTPVTVSWTLTDPESGIASSTGCQTQIVTSSPMPVTITCTATNGDGFSTSQTVTLDIDETAPSGFIGLTRAPDRNGWYNAPIDFLEIFTESGSALSPDCPTVSPPASPYVGPDGANVTVTATCENNAGLVNSQSIAFNYDATDPTIAVSDMTVEATSPSGAQVAFTPVVADNASGVESVACVDGTNATVVSGDLFPLGATSVTCAVTDVAGNTATGSFTITVQDTTAPAIAPLGDITVRATSPSGAVVFYGPPTVTDAVSPGLVATCAPPSGALLPIGTTTVNCSGSDTAGNTGFGTFNVTVIGQDDMFEQLRTTFTTSHGTRSQILFLTSYVNAAELYAEHGLAPMSCMMLKTLEIVQPGFAQRYPGGAGLTSKELAGAQQMIDALQALIGCEQQSSQR